MQNVSSIKMVDYYCSEIEIWLSVLYYMVSNVSSIVLLGIPNSDSASDEMFVEKFGDMLIEVIGASLIVESPT